MSKSEILRQIHDFWDRSKASGTLGLTRQKELALELKGVLSEQGAISFLTNALGVDLHYARAFFTPRSASRPAPTPDLAPAPEIVLKEHPFDKIVHEQTERTRQTVAEETAAREGGKCLTDGSAEQNARRIEIGTAFLGSSSAFDRVCGLVLLRGDVANLRPDDHAIIQEASGDYTTEQYFLSAKHILIKDGYVGGWLTGRVRAWEPPRTPSQGNG